MDTISCTRPPGYKVASELTATSGDCDDNDANEHPGQTWYKDADDDGYSDGTTDTTSCTRPPGYKVASELISTSGDNDDSDAGVNPGATEVPYNGKDDDCNPATPDDDLDQDGYLVDSECDDNDADVHPGATEVCNGIDDDCDGNIDDGVTTIYYHDADADTYGDPNHSTQACSQPQGYVLDNTDCNDTDADVNPGANEVPNNGKDDDCNPATLDEEVLPPPDTGGGSTTPGGGTTTPGGDTDTPSTPSPRGGRSSRTVSGCFIATAAYGTPSAQQIDVLREFRDMVLLESTVGSQCVALYYRLSPPIADFIAGSSLLRTLVRELVVDPIVWVVEATGDMWRN